MERVREYGVNAVSRRSRVPAAPENDEGEDTQIDTSFHSFLFLCGVSDFFGELLNLLCVLTTESTEESQYSLL